MADPVSTCDGHSYERTSIAKWLQRNKTSPVTGDVLSTTNLTDNHALRNSIQEWLHPFPSACSCSSERGTILENTSPRSEADTLAFELNHYPAFKAWLFDNGYTQSDCVSVHEFTRHIRNALVKRTKDACAHKAEISLAIADAKREQLKLLRHQESNIQIIDQTMDAIIEKIIVELNAKRTEMHVRIAEQISAGQLRINEHLASLHATETAVELTLERYRCVLDQDDTKLLSTEDFSTLIIPENAGVDHTDVGFIAPTRVSLLGVSEGISHIMCPTTFLQSVTSTILSVIEDHARHAATDFRPAARVVPSPVDDESADNISRIATKQEDTIVGNTGTMGITGKTTKSSEMVSTMEPQPMTRLSLFASSFLEKFGLTIDDTTWKYVSLFIVTFTHLHCARSHCFR